VVLGSTQKETKTSNSPQPKFSQKLSGFEAKMQLNNAFIRNVLR